MTSNDIEKCYICNHSLAKKSELMDGGLRLINCRLCGKYILNGLLTEEYLRTLSSDDKVRLSGFYRECKEFDLDIYDSLMFLNKENCERLLLDNKLPRKKDVMIKARKMLKYIYKKTSYLGERIDFHNDDYSIAYASNNEECHALLRYLYDKGYIKYQVLFPSSLIELTIYGIQAIKEINSDSSQIFVALGFQSELKSYLIDEDFKKQIEDKTGYKLITIDQKEYNNKICDEIIAEINQSKAIIADFSDNNRGAYYEAGYAHGLGLEVIFVCKDEEKDGKKLIEQVHFDTNHFNHIVWKDKVDLAEQLINRINRTLGKPKN